MKFLFSITTLILVALLISCNSKKNTPEPVSPLNNYPSASFHSLQSTVDAELQGYINLMQSSPITEIDSVEHIPEKFMSHLLHLDPNFRMANDGEVWQVGCSPPIEFDSSLVKTHRDPKTGELLTTVGYKEIDAPGKKMEFFASNQKMAVLIYKSGGIGVSTNIVFMRQENGFVQDYWLGYLGGDFQSVTDIINAFNNGLIEHKGPGHII